MSIKRYPKVLLKRTADGPLLLYNDANINTPYITLIEVIFLQIEIDPGVVKMKHSDHFLCCGDSQGKVNFHIFIPCL